MRFLPPTLVLALSLFAAVGIGAAASPPSADLAVSAVDSPDPVTLGAPFGYTIQVADQGPDQATKVKVTIRIPKFAEFTGATPSAGSCGPVRAQRFSCELGTLPPPIADYSGPPSVTVSLVARRLGILTGSVSVVGHEKDPGETNDKVILTTRVTAPPISCRGQTATVVGTLGDDVLSGTPGPDVIAALNGDDTVFSLSGRDLICAGRGLDRVVTGSAADRVYGGAGDDSLLGRGGPDVLKGMAGRDVLKGNRGSDRLFGGRGPDLCRGGAGADVIRSCERGDRRRLKGSRL